MDLLLIPLKIILPLGLVLVILITVMWVLYYKNKELNKILILEKKRFAQYKKGIENLKNSGLKNSSKDFQILSKFIRAFFKEYYQLNFSLTYLELQNNFKKKGNKEYADFCGLMSDAKYSGKKENKKEIKELINKFYKILLDYETKNK